MKSPEQFDSTETLSTPTKSAEQENIEHVDSLIEQANKIVSGELPYSDGLYSELYKEFYHNDNFDTKKALEIWRQMERLQFKVIHNCILQAKDHINNGDLESGKISIREANVRLSEQLHDTIHPEIGKSLTNVINKLDSEIKEREDRGKAEIEQEKERLALRDQQTLFRYMLDGKLNRNGNIDNSERLSISEQIAKLAEDGRIQDVSIDPKTGRIHLKYKPKTFSLFGTFFSFFARMVDEHSQPHHDQLVGVNFGGSKSGFDYTKEQRAEKYRSLDEHENKIEGESIPKNEDEKKDPIESLRELGVKIEGEGEEAVISLDQESEEGKKVAEDFSDIIKNNDTLAENNSTEFKQLFSFMKDEFGKFGDMPIEDFEKQFTENDRQHFKKFIEQYIGIIINNRIINRISGKYADTNSSVFGDNSFMLDIMQKIYALDINKKIEENSDGKFHEIKNIVDMPFSETVKNHLGIDVLDLNGDYFKHFSPR